MDNFFDELTVCMMAQYMDMDPDTFAGLILTWCMTECASDAAEMMGY